jgi:hypothetical protein
MSSYFRFSVIFTLKMYLIENAYHLSKSQFFFPVRGFQRRSQWPLGLWRGFESCSRHGRLFSLFGVALSCAGGDLARRADTPPPPTRPRNPARCRKTRFQNLNKRGGEGFPRNEEPQGENRRFQCKLRNCPQRLWQRLKTYTNAAGGEMYHIF